MPFWLEILNLKKPRDTFREERIIRALAALALMAVYDETSTAYRGLVQSAKTNPDAAARAQALHYLGEVHAYLENPLPADVIDEIKPIMTEDPVFEPRFQARMLLREHDVPIPLDNPGGAYAFKVKLFWDKRVYRTIELRSEQTLDELHFAIQHALHWDSDHLYSFFMNGELFDEPYGFACPYEEDRPPWTTEAVLGELG